MCLTWSCWRPWWLFSPQVAYLPFAVVAILSIQSHLHHDSAVCNGIYTLGMREQCLSYWLMTYSNALPSGHTNSLHPHTHVIWQSHDRVGLWPIECQLGHEEPESRDVGGLKTLCNSRCINLGIWIRGVKVRMFLNDPTDLAIKSLSKIWGS